jgi:pseudouridine-5'-phosphate glycosidase
VDSPEEVAALVQARDALGLPAALLVTVPVPPRDALSQAEADVALAEAVARAEQQSISGAAVTPFLLAEIDALTAGGSRRANIALLVNNARVAGQIALALVQR